MSFKQETNDPIVGKLRKGTPDDPYKRIVETLQIINGTAQLTEIPNRFDKVIVTGLLYEMREVQDGELSENTYRVDYTQGIVFFHAKVDAQFLVFKYVGRGAHFFPANRIYLTYDKEFWNAELKFRDIDRELNNQRNRVDTLIRENPQPSEVVDIRVDYNGKVYPVAKHRIDAEQKKIEQAYTDLTGKIHLSLKDRIDQEQKKIDDATFDKNGKSFYTLKERIDSEQEKIEEAYEDVNGYIYDSLKKRIDTEYTTFYKRFKYKNAINYGADPTGTLPSADALQRALEDIHTEGGGELYIPSGKYLIDKRMHIYENTTITMSDSTVLLRGWNGGFFANGISTDMFKGYTGRGNIHIRGGVLDGNIANLETYPTNGFDMVAFGHGENITIDNVTFKDVLTHHAIDINGCKKVLIKDSRFIGFQDKSGERNFSEAIQLAEFTLDGLDMFGEYDSTPCTNVVIENNYFGKSDLLGGYGCAVGNHYTVYDVFQTNIIIKNNTIEDCGFAGVRTFKWGEAQVINNIFRRCRDCVYISQASGGINSSKNAEGVQMNLPQNASNILIQGNNFYDYINSGVTTYGQIYNDQVAWSDGIRIMDNYFKIAYKELGSYGLEQAIYLVFARNVFISNNRIYGGRRGVWVEGCFNIFINHNQFSQIDTEAIFLSPSRDTAKIVTRTSHMSIEDNELNTLGRNGFYLQDIDYFDVKSNNIYSTNLEQGGTTDRGGIYTNNCYEGRIENNRVRGAAKSFAILVEANCTEINVSNTNGTGRIIVLGDTNFNGYYGTTDGDYVNQISTKGTSVTWKPITLANGAQSYGTNTKPQYCIINKVVHIRGAVKGITANDTTIAVLPAEARPSTMDYNFVQNASVTSGSLTFTRWAVGVNGQFRFEYKSSGTPLATDWFPIHTSYALE